MTALSSGHLVTDLAQGSLPAFLPFLVDEFGLSYTMAAALVLAGTFASSIIQPLFGLWSDARGALWLLPAGVAIAGVGMAPAALVPSYRLVVLAVVVSGPRRRRVPPGGIEVRELRERRPAGERHVVLLGRRQHRVRARARWSPRS